MSLLNVALRAVAFSKGNSNIPEKTPFETPTWMFARWRADAAENAATAVSQNFIPADVDTSANIITMPDLGFGAPAAYQQAKGTWVYFDTTGILPSPLQTNTPYYVYQNGTSVTVYPQVSGNDWQNIPGAIQDEFQGPAQNYQQGVNSIDFTTQGSGIHRIYTVPLISQLYDLTGNNFHATSTSTTDKNLLMERPSDVDGKSYIQRRISTRDQTLSSYQLHGKQWKIPSAARVPLYGARSVVTSAVIKFQNKDWQSISKWQQNSTSFNTSTGTITRTSHGWSTGWMVKFRPQPGSTIPAGLVSGTAYYCRSVDANTITVHPTATDATNNTNIIIPTNQGSGIITMYASQRPGDIERYRQIFEHYRPDDGSKNALTVFSDDGTGSTWRLNIATAFPTLSGNNNCRLGGAGISPNKFTAPDYAVPFKVRLQIPADCVGPTCVDTGTSLSAGEYWTTAEPGSSAYTRLHRNYDDALACQGLSNTQIATLETNSGSPKCIRYSVAGSGFLQMETADGKMQLQAFIDSTIAQLGRVNIGAKMILTVVADYNDPSATGVRVRAFINNLKVADVDLTSATKGVLASTSYNGPAATLFNSTQGHVALEGDFYEGGIGASTGVITDNDILLNYHPAAMVYHDISVLNTLTLSNNSFVVGDSSGTVIGSIQGITEGSTVSIFPSDNRVSISGNNIIVGPTAASSGNFTFTLRETFVGKSNSPNDSLITINVKPFVSDSDTYFWDFTSTKNITDATGVSTLSYAPELIGAKVALSQTDKEYQPLIVSKGINFNQTSARVLTFDIPPTITNGKTGWYFAATATFTTTASTLMQITRAASSAASRMYLDFTGSRNIRLRYGDNDNATLTTIFTSSQLTLGQKYAIEVLFDTVADTVTLWINGVQQSITVTGTPFSSFPSTNPQSVFIGNISTGTASLDGNLNNIVFYNGLPTSTIRNSISSFQQTRQQEV